MVLTLILLTLINLSFPATDKEIEEAKLSLKALIAPIVSGKSTARSKQRKTIASKFRVDKCEKHQVNWMDIILMRKSYSLEYKFAPGCDIQGVITPKVFQSFPVELALRNIENYDRIKSDNKITSSIEQKPILNLEMRDGVLSGKKGIVKFEADYKVRMNPISPKDPIDKNLGGEMRITEIFGKKVLIKEKILIQ